MDLGITAVRKGQIECTATIKVETRTCNVFIFYIVVP